VARNLQKYQHVKRLLKIVFVLLPLLSCGRLLAQPAGFDVFVPISKYMAQGNADNLSAWFDDNLEIAVVSKGSNASKAQAKQIVKTFFESYSPRSFEVNHTAGRDNMKYALGTLKAGGENFSVTIFVSSKGKSYKIQQLKIERL
jgi:hypothetical protein